MRNEYRSLTEYAQLGVGDDVLRLGEKSISLMVALSQARTTSQALSIIHLATCDMLESSVSVIVIKTLEEMFSPQSDCDDTPAWLDLLRSVRDNWTKCITSESFKHVSRVLGLLVVAGLCDKADVTFDIGTYRLIEPSLCSEHMNAADVADAVFKTVVYFAETGYACFQSRSLQPLLMSRAELLELDTEYGTIISWWDLVKNGNLEKVHNVTDAEFDRRLGLLTDRVTAMLPSLTGFEKKLVADKHLRLLQMRNDYVTMKLSCGMRKAPFVIKLFGKSSQGKTTYGEQVIQALLVSAGLPTERDYRVSYNVADKYMSTMKTNCVVMTLDDFANTKSDFMDQSPTQVLINVCNNQPCYANMADLAQKGKVFIEPRLVLINTNKEDLDAGIYSNCPYSIQRRPNIDIELEAKHEFQYVIDGKACGVDPAKVAAWNMMHEKTATFDDIWNITIKKAVEPEKLSTIAKYKVVEHNGKELSKVSFNEALNYIIDMYHRHDAAQNAIMDKTSNINEQLELCPIPGCKQIKGCCHAHNFNTQFGFDDIRNMWNSNAESFAEFRRTVMHHERWAWLEELPDFGLFNCFSYFGGYLQTFRSFAMLSIMNWFSSCFLTCISWCICGPCMVVFTTIIVTCWSTIQQKYICRMFWQTRLGRFVNTIRFSEITTTFRSRMATRCMAACALIGSLVGLSLVYKTWRQVKAQGALEPETEQDIKERAGETNVWAQVAIRPLPATSKSRTTLKDQLRVMLEKNLTYVTILGKGGVKLKANALFLNTGVAVLPNHYFKEAGSDDLDCIFRKVNPEACGGKFRARVSRLASYHVPGTDLCICYVASGGSFKKLIDYLPRAKIVNHSFEMLYRNIDGDVTCAKGLADVRITGNSTGTDFVGSVYKNFTMNTFGGLCGAVQYSVGTSRMITGIHLGGIDNTPRGCSCPLYYSNYEDALKHIKNVPGVLLGGDEGIFEPKVYDKDVTLDKPLHPKDPINYMPHNSQVEYYGSCPGFVTASSDVKVTKISGDIIDVCDVPNIYRGPKINPNWYGWQTCLANLANPGKMFDLEVLKTAVLDYESVLLPLFKDEKFEPLRPLTDMENTNGIPGIQFIDSINMATAKGFPLTGNKRDIIYSVDDEKYPDGVQFEQFVLDYVKDCEDRYARGERCHMIIKGCVKDEILTKDKCRIFYGNPLALTFLIRRYFLPIIRVLQLNPIKSECAVGVNCYGPEWKQLYSSVVKHGTDRLVGGDYGKYDQKLPSQIILAALRILIDFAREAGYSERDLTIMESMSADIAFAKVAFNGSLIGFTEGTHISGNSLTAVLNGIMGSLNARVYYYSTRKTERNFREMVSFMTYGDDNVGSVSKECDTFTIKGMSTFLGEHGQVYTMPDKESELVDFLPLEEFEFLKRVNKYLPEIDCNVGCLLEKSIFKSLHCYIRGRKAPLTEDEACAQNIDTALREFFNHGRDMYEMRRKQLAEVAGRNQIKHLCSRLDVDYDTCVSEWREKYMGIKMEKAEERFSSQSGSEINLYEKVEAEIPMKLIGVNIPVALHSFGEIDMLFERTVHGKSFVLVVEIKHSKSRSNVAKGCMQVIKQVRALREMRPDVSYVGIVVSHRGTKVVVRNMEDEDSWFDMFTRQSLTTLSIVHDRPFMYI